MTRFAKFFVLALLGAAAQAHEIPNDVTIQSYIRPEGKTLKFLVRVPLAAMRDVAFPDREGGYLDLGKSAPLLSDAATLWIANYVDFYEDDVKLPKPRIVFTRLSLPGREFATWEQAIKHVQAPPLPESTNLFWN